MSFQLSPELDRNKIFLVKRSELEGRLDPIMALYQKKTTQFKYQSEILSNLLKRKPQYGANEAGVERISNELPRYIRITDIDEYGLLKQEIGKTAEKIESKYILQNNDLLFARSGATVGKAYIHKTEEIDYPCFYAGYMIRFVTSEEKIDSDYFFAYTQLSVYKEWVTAIQRAAGQPNINAEEYKSLRIPIPPKKIQAQIVAKMGAAYSAKKQKEAEAQRLLDSIDNYLLGELGIDLPEQIENTLENRIFTRRLSEISGYRLDPNTYKKERLDAIRSVENGTYDAKPLYQVLNHKTDKTSVIESGIKYIGLENIESDTGEFVETDDKESISSAAIFGKGDILFPKLRPYLNKVFYSEIEGLCSTEFHVLSSPFENNEYIANFLRSKIVVTQTKNLMSGNTLPRLQFEDIQKFLLPTPPIAKQNEITDHITYIRNQAKQLKQQAKNELEKAKKEVETMILGEDESRA